MPFLPNESNGVWSAHNLLKPAGLMPQIQRGYALCFLCALFSQSHILPHHALLFDKPPPVATILT